MAGGTRVSLVDVERIAIADRQREVADRSTSDLLGRGVANLAADPSPKLICQQRADGPSLRWVYASRRGITARESTSI
jgi:hypothetical protein